MTSPKCPDCKGSGKYVGLGASEPCRACGGAGVAKADFSLKKALAAVDAMRATFVICDDPYIDPVEESKADRARLIERTHHALQPGKYLYDEAGRPVAVVTESSVRHHYCGGDPEIVVCAVGPVDPKQVEREQRERMSRSPFGRTFLARRGKSPLTAAMINAMIDGEVKFQWDFGRAHP
jgi:hypothetical protein